MSILDDIGRILMQDIIAKNSIVENKTNRVYNINELNLSEKRRYIPDDGDSSGIVLGGYQKMYIHYPYSFSMSYQKYPNEIC